MSQVEFPVPGWGHDAGFLAIGTPEAPAERSEAQDRSLVAERIVRYGWALDERRSDLVEDCFTEDAVWEGAVAGSEALGPIVGRDAVVGWLTVSWARQLGQRRHLIANLLVEELSATAAHVSAYQLLTIARSEEVAVDTTGFLRVDLRQQDGGWRIGHLFCGYDAPLSPSGRSAESASP
jgi:hypothetical protein